MCANPVNQLAPGTNLGHPVNTNPFWLLLGMASQSTALGLLKASLLLASYDHLLLLIKRLDIRLHFLGFCPFFLLQVVQDQVIIAKARHACNSPGSILTAVEADEGKALKESNRKND
ncbi:hypothetical protein L345_09420, partial [Ophiophagus hannah]